MAVVDVVLVLLLEFYTSVWNENPGKFPVLKTEISLENLKRHGSRQSVRKDLIELIKGYMKHEHNVELDNNLGDKYHKQRNLDKLIKNGKMQIQLDDKVDKEIEYRCTDCICKDKTIERQL